MSNYYDYLTNFDMKLVHQEFRDYSIKVGHLKVWEIWTTDLLIISISFVSVELYYVSSKMNQFDKLFEEVKIIFLNKKKSNSISY